MALSNWDTWAMNEKSEPVNGRFVSPMGICVEIYKNWIYVQDEKAWREKGGRTKPYIMEIHHADMNYLDVHITAKKIDDAQYVSVWSYGKKDPDKKTGMIGIGSCGYRRNGYVGITKKQLKILRRFLKEGFSDEYHYNSIPSQFRELDFEKGLRFNQGDAFFDQNLKISMGVTNVGEAGSPLLSRMIDSK